LVYQPGKGRKTKNGIMTGEQLRQLEAKLWGAADQLRANSKLTASEYSMPVLGLIFLKQAYRKYTDAREALEASLPEHPVRGKRPLRKDDFTRAKAIYLPKESQWDFIADLPEGTDPGEALDNAMRAIEAEYEVLQGVLPKNYSIFETSLLQRLIRIFNAEELDKLPGDLFGMIYEYFLNKFAMTGAQEGGEFFTPRSLVNTIVNIIEPNHGIVFDPACGSAGMFIQTGHFIERRGQNPAEKVTFYGQEKAALNTRLAKMNMTVHGLDGMIMEGNTFYEDKHSLAGKCDFVMANPPFNVDGVDKDADFVKNDQRLPFGFPRNDNANYLWIQYFYGYLNATGRAGFVMASSASDAGHSEKEIRRKLVKTGAVDVMVAIGTKFFYTRSLPCTLWFFDREKEAAPDRNQQTLMLDLREIFRKVSSNFHDFTTEHLRNIQSIVGLYRGNSTYLEESLQIYADEQNTALQKCRETLEQIKQENQANEHVHHPVFDALQAVNFDKLKEIRRKLNHAYSELEGGVKDNLKNNFKNNGKEKREVNAQLTRMKELVEAFNRNADQASYFRKQEQWLRSRFPDGEYTDVPGLCKVVNRDEIAANDYSLTPGRYVGVAPQEDDGVDFESRMTEIKQELGELNDEATLLARQIQDNLTELGI
jgi:type I restriction enzyme M protein